MDFGALLPVGTELEFCSSGGSGPGDITGVLYAEMPGVRALFTGERITLGALSGTFSPPLATFTGTYKPKGLPRVYACRWRRAELADQTVSAPWVARRIADPAGTAARWFQGVGLARTVAARWARGAVADLAGQAMVWGPAAVVARVVPVPWSATRFADPGPVAAPWGRGLSVAIVVAAPWAAGQSCAVVVPCPWGPSTLRDRADVVWPIVWPVEPDPEYEIPDRGTYIVPYSVGVIRLSDGAEIDCASLALSTDVDSWAWSLTAQMLNRESFDRVQPQGGEAVVVQVSINGYIWQFLVDDPTRSEAFNADTYTVTARSITARLATPYTRPRDYTSTSSATAQQHALTELPLSGWTLNWTAPDWIVPAGAWTYQGLNPQQAITRLAAAVGATLQSDRAGQGLVVQPRYPVMPWNLPDAIPDYSLPLSACLRTQRRPSVPGTRPNAVYVQGGEVGGVLGRVFKSDTAGDISRATVVGALITDTIAARGLGGQLLADGWQPPEVADILVPLTEAAGDYPIIGIGNILALTDGPAEHLGICTGLTIQVTAPGLSRSQGPEVTQQAFWHGRQINPWSRLQALSPSPPLLVGQVVSVGGDQATIRLTGGGIITARGIAAVNDWVYVRNGIMEGLAPALSAVDIGV